MLDEKRSCNHVINFRLRKLQKKHKRLFYLLKKLKGLFRRDKKQEESYGSSYRNSVNH